MDAIDKFMRGANPFSAILLGLTWFLMAILVLTRLRQFSLFVVPMFPLWRKAIATNPTAVKPALKPTAVSTVSTKSRAINTSVSISLVIPTVNEAANLPHVLPRIPAIVNEVIIVDGYSTDETIHTALRLRPDAKVILAERRGKGSALRAGFAAATGEIIVMLDGDGSMAPEEIPMYVSALFSGADFAKGTRFIQGGGTDDMEFHRYLGNKMLMWFARFLFGGQYSDLCYGFNAFWRSALPALDLQSTGFEIETEMNIRALMVGLKVLEIPSFESPRVNGVSNLSAIRDGIRIVRTMLWEKMGYRRQTDIGEVVHVGQGRLGAAIELLIREAQHLNSCRTKLSDEAYSRGVAAISLSYDMLMNSEIADPYDAQIQQLYRQQYGDDSARLFGFTHIVANSHDYA